MDRQQALDVLDSLTPRQRHAARAQASVEVRAACDVLEEDAEGRRQLELRRQLETETPIDLQIGRAIRNIAVPVGARERLLQRLAATTADTLSSMHSNSSPLDACRPEQAAPSTSHADGQTPSSLSPPICASVVNASPASIQPASTGNASASQRQQSSRRRWMLSGLVAAILAVVAGVWQLRSSRLVPVGLEEARLSAAADPSALPAFSSDLFAPRPPAGSGWQRIEFDQNESGAPDFRELRVGKTPAAACRFRIVDRGRVRLTGHLVVLRKDTVIDPPQSTLFSLSGGVHYAGGIASVTWTEGDLVFLCYVRGGEESLKLLERALDIRLS